MLQTGFRFHFVSVLNYSLPVLNCYNSKVTFLFVFRMVSQKVHIYLVYFVDLLCGEVSFDLHSAPSYSVSAIFNDLDMSAF